MITANQLAKIAGLKSPNANMQSIAIALSKYGDGFGLNKPHRLAHYIGQLAHESGRFRFDKEIWGPTKAQKKYDIRTDLGNTAKRDGDGKKYMGRTGVMITGKSNYAQFRDWCRKNIMRSAPDFVEEPEAVNKDPWEGLAPIWYWSTRNLNRYADLNDLEMITRRINGGYNGLVDRILFYTRTALVLAGYEPDQVQKFQSDNGLVADDIAGPKTRAKLHKVLAGQEFVFNSPTPDVIVPKSAEKRTVVERNAWWITATGMVSSVFSAFASLDPWVQIAFIAIAAFGAWIAFNNIGKISRQIKDVKRELAF